MYAFERLRCCSFSADVIGPYRPFGKSYKRGGSETVNPVTKKITSHALRSAI